VAAGDTVVIAEGEKHGIKAETTLEIIEVQIGDKLTEDDITRYEMAWWARRYSISS
jgi:mannose-1-phosphate guanylyltransferase